MATLTLTQLLNYGWSRLHVIPLWTTPGLGPEVTPLAYWFSSSSFQNRPPVPPTDRTTPSVENSEAHGMCLIQEMLEKAEHSKRCCQIKNVFLRKSNSNALKLKECMKQCYDSVWVIYISKDGYNTALNGQKIPLVPLQMNWLISSLDFTKRAKDTTLWTWRTVLSQHCP